ncbi:MAG TPA: deaminase [Candidatus Dojkabacteria bacterium]|nr:deaminase [Candidatus Dojkabacteria bacterium]
MHRFIKQAVEEAQKSEHKQKVGAIIFDKSKIISKGFNHPQRSVKHLKSKFQKWPGTVHAEVDAIIKAKTDLKNLSMLVIRVNNKNQLRLAQPCRWCQMYLEYVGIKKVYYSTNEYPYIDHLIINGKNNNGK